MKGKNDIRHQVAKRSGHRDTSLAKVHVHEVVDSRRNSIARKRRKENTGHGGVAQAIVGFELRAGSQSCGKEVAELLTRGIKAC